MSHITSAEEMVDLVQYRFLVAGFSMGPRNCICHHFALAEAVCIISLLIRRFEVLVPASLEGKTIEEKKRQVLALRPGISTSASNAWLHIKERRN